MRDKTSVDTGAAAPKAAREENFVVLAPGTRIGRYEFLSVLGHGGFGITYAARDTTLGRDLAIKEYLPTSLALRNSDSVVIARSTQVAEDFVWGRERFLDEARTLATLEGAPGVVRVYDFLEANGTAYMVMALARGETLEQRLKREGRLPAPLVERLLHRLLYGLEKVHEAGFLHRDIKPGNIILDADDNPTLIDFGASRLSVADRTSAMTAVFTPRYAASEQLMSDKQGPWTDVYGVAVTLYHAITGQSPPGALERALKDTYEPLARLRPVGFSRQLLEGIDAGMAVRAADRPQSIADWRALLDGTTAPGESRPRARPARSAAPAPASPDDTVAPVATVALAAPPAATPVAPPIAAASTRPRAVLWIAAASVAIVIAGAGAYFAFMPREPATNVSDRQRIDDQVRRAREQLALAEQAAQRQADEEARQVREAEARRAAAAAAEKQRAEEEATRQAALRTEQERRDREAARQKAEAEAAARQKAETEEARRKADAEAAERARALQEVQKAREALAAAEAARKQAEAEAERLRAEAAARAKAEAEASKQRADAEAAAKAKAEADAAKQKAEDEAAAKARAEAAAARQKAEAETAARARAEAEAAAKRKADAEATAAAKAKAEAEAAAKLKAEAEAAAKQKAEAEAIAAAKARAEIETAARQKATAEAATAAKARAEAEAAAAKARAEAEAAAKQKAEAEAAAAKARAEAEVATRRKAEAEAAAAKAKTEAEAAAKQKVEAEAAAKQKADAATVATATQQKADDDQRKAAEAGETALRLSPADRQRLQVALTALGFDTRGADGVLGPRSREMIANWQRRQTLPATGFLTAAQQQALLREAAPAIARYEEEQKKAAEAKRLAEGEARARATQQPPAPAAAAPAAAAPTVAPTPQPSGSRDGLWFGAIDCKGSGRQSVQGNVVSGSGRLSGSSSNISLSISGNTVIISVQGLGGSNAASGTLSGELRGRSVFARGVLSRMNGSDECTVSLVGP